jgi:hypothetical protein
MRQLKGKVKENAREKRERKKEFMENKEKAFSIGKISVSDPDPGWICLQSVQWNRILDPDPDPGGQKLPTKIEKKTQEISWFQGLDVLF